MHRVKIAAGDTLYGEGEPTEHAFLILSGEAAMERNGVALSAGKGAVIGFSALVGRPYGATATAITDSDLLVFTRKELRGIIRSDPDWAMLIIEGIIDLVGRMNAAAEPKPASITEPGN
jgi:CRP-like cAMP-binding protein